MELQGEINILGEVNADVISGDPVLLGGSRSRELLAALAVEPGTRVRREELCGRIWSNSNELSARKALNTELWRLRSAVRDAGGNSDEWFESQQNYIRICPENGITTDLLQIQAILNADENIELDQLVGSVELYRGHFAADVNAEWVEDYRETIRRSFCELLEQSIDALRKAEMFSKAFSFADRMIRENPFDERGHRALLLVQIESGDLSAAVQHYRELESLLAKELGIEPSCETRELMESQDIELDQPKHFSIEPESPVRDRSISITRHKLLKLKKTAKEMIALIEDLEDDLNF